jgi:hypothetical protein
MVTSIPAACQLKKKGSAFEAVRDSSGHSADRRRSRQFNERVNQLVNEWSRQPQGLSQLAIHSGREDARSLGGNGTSPGQ